MPDLASAQGRLWMQALAIEKLLGGKALGWTKLQQAQSTSVDDVEGAAWMRQMELRLAELSAIRLQA